ncbi:hypothetical protein EGW08_017057 [Elysia chlorotica]|uniref:Uncharacterized protein n=1 Tax=Elysia chlorotica TaxID=188477 RepID=A0A3S1BUH3_ELYCH|nr:hypothetical protein EGW08_017057 [Elysia chlorotica]
MKKADIIHGDGHKVVKVKQAVGSLLHNVLDFSFLRGTFNSFHQSWSCNLFHQSWTCNSFIFVFSIRKQTAESNCRGKGILWYPLAVDGVDAICLEGLFDKLLCHHLLPNFFQEVQPTSPCLFSWTRFLPKTLLTVFGMLS